MIKFPDEIKADLHAAVANHHGRNGNGSLEAVLEIVSRHLETIEYGPYLIESDNRVRGHFTLNQTKHGALISLLAHYVMLKDTAREFVDYSQDPPVKTTSADLKKIFLGY